MCYLLHLSPFVNGLTDHLHTQFKIHYTWSHSSRSFLKTHQLPSLVLCAKEQVPLVSPKAGQWSGSWVTRQILILCWASANSQLNCTRQRSLLCSRVWLERLPRLFSLTGWERITGSLALVTLPSRNPDQHEETLQATVVCQTQEKTSHFTRNSEFYSRKPCHNHYYFWLSPTKFWGDWAILGSLCKPNSWGEHRGIADGK